MKIPPTYERVRLGRWVATQPTGGKSYDNGNGTITVPISGYVATAPVRFLAARRLRRFLAEQGAAS